MTTDREMTCNNCGDHMRRSEGEYYHTVCHTCGMRHIWPEPKADKIARLRAELKRLEAQR